MTLPRPDPPPLAHFNALVMTSVAISARFSTGTGQGQAVQGQVDRVNRRCPACAGWETVITGAGLADVEFEPIVDTFGGAAGEEKALSEPTASEGQFTEKRFLRREEVGSTPEVRASYRSSVHTG